MFHLFKKKEKEGAGCLKAPATGRAVPMSESSDPTFSSGMLGNGVVIHPDGGVVTAPCDGTITALMEDTKHAVGIHTEQGFDLLLHIGVDTVSLKGEGFESFVSSGDKVKAGDKLLQFDQALIESRGLCSDVIMIVMDAPELPEIRYVTGIEVKAGETVVAEIK